MNDFTMQQNMSNEAAEMAEMNPQRDILPTASKTPTASNSQFRALMETLGDAIIPKKYRKNIMNYLERASIEEVPYFYFGVAAVALFGLALILDILLMTTKTFSNANVIVWLLATAVITPVIFLALAVVAIIIFRLYLEAMIFHKVRKMEEIFPEFLSELALNLKSGQGLEESLENSNEKEFGYLGSEIQRVCKKVRLGVDIEVALKEFTSGYDSEIIEETFNLIVTSWKKGAATSQLVDRVYDNLDIIRYLRRKVIASVSGYRIFLSVVTVIIAPIMFALSYYLIDLIRSITTQIAGVSSGTAFPFSINAVRINDQQFILFSTIAVVLVSMCTAMIISIIKTGSVKEGYKQLLIFAGMSVLSYRLALFLFNIFFGMFNI